MAKATDDQYIVLKSIHIGELKGLKDCEISFDSPLTAIMGVNGIGKSTIIHALSCCFRKVDDYGEERKFLSFFPPSTNSTWKNSNFVLKYDIVTASGEVIKEETKEYKKGSDRWTPRYNDQRKKNIKYLGIDTCMPDIERLKKERYKFKTTERTDKNAKKIIQQASIILNKDYESLTLNKYEKKEMMGVITGHALKYSSLSMGAGEQRVFRILEALISAPIYSLILIDEIDLLLHPDALKRLVEYIHEIAIDKHLQIIFTTHSLIMGELKHYANIKYLDWHEGKVDVYDGITSLGWRMLSGDPNKPISIYVEDDLSVTIIKRIARNLNMLQKINVGKFGAAVNAFTLAASFIMRDEDIEHVLIVLDGDRYKTEEEKTKQIRKSYSGSEEDADKKREKALSLITQYKLPDEESPESFLHKLISTVDSDDEIIDSAKRINAVSDSHEWINRVAEAVDDGTDTIIAEIIDVCSKTDGWNDYIQPISEWMNERANL